MQTDTLYILVRTDLASMGLGKSCAQAAHAANQFTNEHIIKPLTVGADPDPDVIAWSQQANGFGTTFTLAVPSLLAMLDTVDAAETLGFKAGSVVDPTYPFLVPNEMVNRLNSDILTAPTLSYGRDRSLCFAQETTTAYIFGKKAALSVLLARYDPLPNE